ncbi:hypothetical protein [Anabaena azotica]|uniref:hypothetical protein n=1 Tax=Anabaena azotica TaxID=197653 RepID=UPI0039A624B7
MTNHKFRKNQDTNKQGNRQKEDFSFRYRPLANTVDGKLIAYLQQENKPQTAKEMILQALRMCWLPLAYKAQTDVGISDQEVRRISLMCCHALEQHLAYLRIELGLPHKSSDVLPVPLSTMTNPQTLAAMFALDVGNSSDEHTINKNQDSTNSNSGSESQRIDSDSFIPGKGSFHDDDNDMFADI